MASTFRLERADGVPPTPRRESSRVGEVGESRLGPESACPVTRTGPGFESSVMTAAAPTRSAQSEELRLSPAVTQGRSTWVASFVTHHRLQWWSRPQRC
jgi:hypothetical protein